MPWFKFGSLEHRQRRHRHGRRLFEGRETLAGLRSGQKAKILRIGGSGQIRHRLIELGFHTGETVEKIKAAPLNDPLEIAVNGGRVSIRRSEAELIDVELISV